MQYPAAEVVGLCCKARIDLYCMFNRRINLISVHIEIVNCNMCCFIACIIERNDILVCIGCQHKFLCSSGRMIGFRKNCISLIRRICCLDISNIHIMRGFFDRNSGTVYFYRLRCSDMNFMIIFKHIFYSVGRRPGLLTVVESDYIVVCCECDCLTAFIRTVTGHGKCFLRNLITDYICRTLNHLIRKQLGCCAFLVVMDSIAQCCLFPVRMNNCIFHNRSVPIIQCTIFGSCPPAGKFITFSCRCAREVNA